MADADITNAFPMHRVKVYKLDSEGCWEDKGTGHISVEYMEASRG